MVDHLTSCFVFNFITYLNTCLKHITCESFETPILQDELLDALMSAEADIEGRSGNEEY
jgi:hypothetical protein